MRQGVSKRGPEGMVGDEKRLMRLEFFHDFSQVMASTLEPRRLLNRILEAAVTLTRATSGSLLLRDRESQLLNIRATLGYPDRRHRMLRLRVGEGITGWVVKHRRPLLVGDVRRDPRYVELDRKIRSELAVPLMLKQEVIGVINVNSHQRDAFGEEDVELLSALAGQSSSVIQNAILFDTVRGRGRALAGLFNVGKLITGTLDRQEVLQQIVTSAAKRLRTKLCSLMLLNEEGTELVIQAVHGGSPDYASKPNLPVAQSLIGRVVQTRRPLLERDVRKAPGYHFLDLARKEGLCSLLSVPLTLKGKVIGTINTYKATQYEFSREEVDLLSSLADLSAIAIENARLYETTFKLEDQIRRMERMATLQELAIEMAHEIRNPLTIIRMLVHALRAENRRDVAIIEGEVSRLEQLASRFLDHCRPRAPELAPLDLSAIAERALQLLGPRTERQRVRVVKEFGDRVPPVLADREQLEQVFLNLLLNAVDAMPEGGTLKVSTRRRKGQVEVLVSDTGPGIPSEVRERLFEPFLTTKPGGVGLGLSIVRRIVEGHGGGVRAESQPGKGTVFRVELPAAPEGGGP